MSPRFNPYPFDTSAQAMEGYQKMNKTAKPQGKENIQDVSDWFSQNLARRAENQQIQPDSGESGLNIKA